MIMQKLITIMCVIKIIPTFSRTTASKRVSREAVITGAYWLMVLHGASCVETTGAHTWIYTCSTKTS